VIGPVRLYAGLMSGTSLDAVDGALVAFRADAPPATLAFCSRPMPAALRAVLQALQQPGHDELARAALAANALADLYAQVTFDLLAASGRAADTLEAIGAHGQTVRHRPELGYTIQLLNPARLAERTGIAVVADLRSAEVAAGGQGAPLVPAFHATVFGHQRLRRAVVNLGGIANVSLIEPRKPGADANLPVRAATGDGPGGAGSDDSRAVLGFDTGPANMLLDLWCERHNGQPFDRDGSWAARGQVLPKLLERLLEEPYFHAPAPKSTGRDLFDAHWLESRLAAATVGGPFDPRDVQATLAQLTADTVARACLAFAADEAWVCGGGVRNADLMQRLRARLAPMPMADTAVLGIDPQAVEAAAFAWLAYRRLSNLPGNVPAVTGARGQRTLGAVWPAQRRWR
jgi:anhydro-N-acetylmuramic acid kinase